VTLSWFENLTDQKTLLYREGLLSTTENFRIEFCKNSGCVFVTIIDLVTWAWQCKEVYPLFYVIQIEFTDSSPRVFIPLVNVDVDILHLKLNSSWGRTPCQQPIFHMSKQLLYNTFLIISGLYCLNPLSSSLYFLKSSEDFVKTRGLIRKRRKKEPQKARVKELWQIDHIANFLLYGE
jgi:hypothetical protein